LLIFFPEPQAPCDAPKLFFGWGSALDPDGRAYDAPPEPVVGWGGGHLLHIPPPDAFGLSM